MFPSPNLLDEVARSFSNPDRSTEGQKRSGVESGPPTKNKRHKNISIAFFMTHHANLEDLKI